MTETSGTSLTTCALGQNRYIDSEPNSDCGWLMILDEDLADFRLHEISESDYDRFRDGVQPPVAYGFAWNGRQWDFACAGSYGFLYAFGKRDGRFFAQKTDLLNPEDVRLSIREQVAHPDLLKEPTRQRLSAITAAWTPAWRQLASSLSQLSHLDRLKDRRPVSICESDGELLDQLKSGAKEIGSLIARENLCFVALSYDGSEWGIMKEAQLLGTFDVQDISNDWQLGQDFLIGLRRSRSAASGRSI
jgi:hypothetical protein